MNIKSNRRVPTEFGPDTRFELKPAATSPFLAAQEKRFEGLKDRLLRERLELEFRPEINSYLRRAANEAAALAWVTCFPLLVFPVLFEEKAQSALLQAERQKQVLRRSRELLVV